MKTNLLLLTFLILLVSVSLQGKEPVGIKNLKTTVQENPSSPGKIVPCFSWQMQSRERNQFQSAYQVLLFENDPQSKSTKGAIWDSGKIDSNQSVLVSYTGPELRPAHTYFWKVKIWNQRHEPSPWSDLTSFHTGLLSEADWAGAQWIGYRDFKPELKIVPGIHGSGNELGQLGLLRPVVPLLRKEFEASADIESAVLSISGLGHYEAFINGKKVGNSFLAPGWTNYDKTVLYNSYDVTSLLRSGENVIGAIVGNGFYNINRERYRKIVIAYGEPKLLAYLKIKYKSGAEKTVVSGTDWKASPSPIIYTSIYGGEDYDARVEQAGWDKAGFDDKEWQKAVWVTPPTGKLTRESDYPLEVKETFTVKNIKKLDDGAYLYDFAQNASGIIELKVQGRKGQEIRLTPSELIKKDNQPNQSASGSPYYFSYILKGDGVEIWRPRFTYYGFRYVKVEGATPGKEDQKAQLIELKLLHNRNSTPSAGSFSCSSDLFNRTFELINWGIKSNLQSVLTDCPHREKLGWLEQTFLMGSSVHFNFDIYNLYRKQVNDMMEAQLENGLVPDIAPEYVAFGGGFRDSPEWGSASVILPWLIYKWYGDVSVMKKAWPMMVRYAEFLRGKSDQHILSHGLGDWFDYGPRQPGEAQLTPKALTATSIYYYDVKLLSEMASVLKKEEEQKQFSAWADEIKKAFNLKFYHPETGVISTGSQTAMAMPWCVGLVDDQNKSMVLQNLEDSIRAKGKPLTAGDVGFRYLVEALTNGGKSQLLYEMNARDDVPGYGFQLKKGATALTESWPALENVSNNHLMLGHLMDWFYAGLGGIGQSEKSVGYHEIVIKPEMVGDLTWAKANYQSPYGEIRSEWTKNEKIVTMNITIPENTTALVYIPIREGSVIREGGKDISGIKDITLAGEEKGRKIYRVGSGIYSFSVQ